MSDFTGRLYIAKERSGHPAWWFVGGMMFAAVALTAIGRAPNPMDDTDPPNGRSGLLLYTDNATGVQYVAIPLAGITPRLNADGTVRAGTTAGKGD